MLRKLVIFGICAGSSASFPILYQSNPDAMMAYLSERFSSAKEQAPVAGTDPGPSSKPIMATQSAGGGRRISLHSDARGHFTGTFKLNGRNVEAMVDTGATAVAINLSTARRAGIAISQADLTHAVSTANGTAKVAIVTIDRLDIGRISVDDVKAIVFDDEALGTILIGMTFLNRLSKYQVDAGAMTLVQ